MALHVHANLRQGKVQGLRKPCAARLLHALRNSWPPASLRANPDLNLRVQVRMRFDIEQGEYLRLAKPEAAFPLRHFPMLADSGRNEACPRLSPCMPSCTFCLPDYACL